MLALHASFDPRSLCPLHVLHPCSFADQNTAFACGGSGSLFKSADGGKSWKRDKATDNGVAGNLYAIKFTGATNGCNVV
jgi:photosystem II stability/assembly factor-like uncharacterized protein